MTEQWQELKETITEMRDNDGTGTQQEVCKFLVNYMGVLEKQMQEPCEVEAAKLQQAYNKGFEDCRQAMFDYLKTNVDDFPDYHEAIEKVLQLPSATQKSGNWITKPHVYGVAYCSECDFELKIDDTNYCPNCGAKMVEPQESEE